MQGELAKPAGVEYIGILNRGHRPPRKGRQMTSTERAADHGQMAIDLMRAAIDPSMCPNDLVASMTDMAIIHARAAWRTVNTMRSGCPGCSGAGVLTDDPQVLKCTRCHGFFTEDFSQPITFEQALQFVALGQPMLANAGADGSFYFDLAVTTRWKGAIETARVHGWADRKTKRVVQYG